MNKCCGIALFVATIHVCYAFSMDIPLDPPSFQPSHKTTDVLYIKSTGILGKVKEAHQRKLAQQQHKQTQKNMPLKKKRPKDVKNREFQEEQARYLMKIPLRDKKEEKLTIMYRDACKHYDQK